MGLDDLGKAVNSYKKWFTSITDKADIYINDAIESMGDPFKYNGLTNNLRKSSINNLTDYLNDIQGFKESSIKQINSAFERAQKVNGDIIDEIKPLYQQALDKINASMENVSIYEQQLAGLKNVEKYKEGTKAFNRGFNNVREEYLVRQEMEIEDIWDRDSKAQQKLYNDMNKRYTQTYHPEIDNTSGYYYSDQNSAFLNDDALKQYEALKQMAPDMIITEQSYNWETDIDRAHELALRENNQFDFVRQAEEREKRRVNNRTTAQSQVNNSTATQVNNSTATQSQTNTTQNQVNREPKKRRKSYADRTTKPINSDFNNAYYGQYDTQIGGYEYVDYKSHYSGGVSRSVYDEEWIAEKTFGEAHSNSEYGIESPWSTNRAQTDVPKPPPGSTVNVANNTPSPMDNLNKLLNKNHPEKRMWVNRDFVFGDNYINNKDFNRTVTEFYSNTENAGKLFEKIAKFSDLEFSPNDFKIYENMFDTYKRATGQTTKDVQQQIINQFKEWRVGPKEIQKHFRLIKEAAEEVGWQGNYEHLDYSSFKIDDVIETRKKPKLKNVDKSYRPEVTMNGNNIEIDSIYNYSTPKKLDPRAGDNKNKVPDPEPETTPQSDIPNSEPEVETVEQDVDNTNLDNTVDNFEVSDGYGDDPTTWTDEDIVDMADGDPDLYQELLNRREQARGGNTNTDSNTNTNSNKFANDPNDPTTWSDDYIEEMSEGDPHYYEELRQRREKAFEEAINSQGSKPPGPFSDNFDPNDPSTWTDNDKRRMNTPDQWTDDDIRKLADGDMDSANELNRMRNGEFGPYGHNPINDFDFDDAPVPDTSYKHAPDTEILDNSISTKTLSKLDVAMTGLNIIGAIGDYKSYRREGDGVISAGIKTGAKLAIEEALGYWALPIALVKTVPGMAIKGADALYKENRRMNSAANFTLFGDAQFMDTQQLATMRQSGMEMAKMSQYNLQQTLMGNEATYLHR